MTLLLTAYSSEETALSPKAPSCIRHNAAWEQTIEDRVGIHRITERNLESFCVMLQKDRDLDSYLTSPAYYSFTGRKGLWIYQKQDAFVPFCWHPNIPGQIIIFPQRGRNNIEIFDDLIDVLPKPPSGARLVRVRSGSSWSDLKALIHPVVLSPVVEHVLDWKFPVRVLSTERVMRMEGPDFRYIRNRVRQIALRNVQVENYTETNKIALKKFVNKWASDRTSAPCEISNLSSPYDKIIEMMNNKLYHLHGLIFKIDGELQAFTVWDISNGFVPTANRFVNLCNLTYKGLSDFVTRYTTEFLYNSGVHFLNIGGSETSSLDQFKNKFMPIFSLNLHSIDAVYEDQFANERRTTSNKAQHV